MATVPLVGRAAEQAELSAALARARAGRGALVLLAGEAGVGKTRLAREALAASGGLVCTGAASQEATEPYGPLVAALRAYLRQAPGSLTTARGPLGAYLALLLPELGLPPKGGDRLALNEAIRCALESMAHAHPGAVLFLDDLHWADHTTLELLPYLATWVEQVPLLVLGAYRSDEIPRGHLLRWVRTELRRSGSFHEVPIPPLDADETAALAGHLLGTPLGATLAATLFDRSQGVPFFVEELANGLATGSRLQRTAGGLGLAAAMKHVPVPGTVRAALLLRTDSLTADAQEALEVAAVAGLHFDLDLVALLAPEGEQALTTLLERGLIVETGDEPGQAAFRHALVREAIYAEIGWPRRRTLHRWVAERLDARGARPDLVAEHWLAAREMEQARGALVLAAEASYRVHAYRDAARAAQRALDLWPDQGDEAGRLALLHLHARACERSGDLAEAARAWREVAAGRHAAGELLAGGEAERHLACLHEIQGTWDRAAAVRRSAADTFAAARAPAEAAAERLAAASHLLRAGGNGAARELIQSGLKEAERGQRDDLRVRALALQGVLRVREGQVEEGIDTLRSGLTLALERGQVTPAADAYRALAGVLESAAADYPAAREVYREAVTFCRGHGVDEQSMVCLSCLAWVQRQTGEWDRAVEMAREVLAAADAPLNARAIASGMLGWILATRGDASRATAPLLEGLALAPRAGNVAMELECLAALGSLDERAGSPERALERARLVYERWQGSGLQHYAIPSLLWATTCCASLGFASDARACTSALAEVAAGLGHAEALAALACALGELSLLDGAPAQAASQFKQALDLVRDVGLPYQVADVSLRTGLGLVAAGAPVAGLDHLAVAYHGAQRLGARPLAWRVAREMAALGEPVRRHLGRRAAGHLARGGLSHRELEVVRLIAVGQTNQEIGRELYLSTRTLDMHVRNLLAKLGSRSRAEATHRAGELGLLAPLETYPAGHASQVLVQDRGSYE